MTHPEWLSDEAAAAWIEVTAGMGDLAGPALSAVEAYCVQVARMRDARARVDAEGLIVADEKGRPVKHPAVELELAASAELRLWTARRPDLFARVVEGGGSPLDAIRDDLAAARAARLPTAEGAHRP